MICSAPILADCHRPKRLLFKRKCWLKKTGFLSCLSAGYNTILLKYIQDTNLKYSRQETLTLSYPRTAGITFVKFQVTIRPLSALQEIAKNLSE